MNSLVSSYSSTLRAHTSDIENSEASHTRSPYQTTKTSGGKVRYEPVYLREILNSDLGYPTSTPVSTACHASFLWFYLNKAVSWLGFNVLKITCGINNVIRINTRYFKGNLKTRI